MLRHCFIESRSAEQLDLRCFAMQIHPQHVDVAVRRWKQFTGKHAVHAVTGEPFPNAQARPRSASLPLQTKPTTSGIGRLWSWEI